MRAGRTRGGRAFPEGGWARARAARPESCGTSRGAAVADTARGAARGGGVWRGGGGRARPLHRRAHLPRDRARMLLVPPAKGVGEVLDEHATGSGDPYSQLQLRKSCLL